MKKTIKIILLVTVYTIITLLFLNFASSIIIKYSYDENLGEINKANFMIIATIFLIIIEGTCCIITARLAKKKNRNILAWIAASLFINPLSFIVLYFLPENKDESKAKYGSVYQ